MEKLIKEINKKRARVEKLGTLIDELQKEKEDLKTLEKALKIMRSYSVDSMKAEDTDYKNELKLKLKSTSTLDEVKYPEAAEEILREAGNKPMHLNEIHKRVKEKYIHLDHKPSLNAALSRMLGKKFERVKKGIYQLIDYSYEMNEEEYESIPLPKTIGEMRRTKAASSNHENND